MRHHQGDRGRAVDEGQHAESPAGTGLRVDRQLRALVQPVADVGAGPGVFRDVKFRRLPLRDPAIPAERKRGTFDPPPQQAVSEIPVKTLQLVEVERVLIEPPDLHDFLLTRGTMSRVEGLV
jgi:hypothetical protein